jgi:uncharacterized membrane protein YbaN (DUF454 family)
MDALITNITNYISIPLILISNLLIFWLIKLLEKFDKHKVFSRTEKRFIAFIVISIVSTAFYLLKISAIEVVILSACLAPLTYAFVIKKLAEALNITMYRKEDSEL